MPRRKRLLACDIEQHAARHQRRHRLDAEHAETGRAHHTAVDIDSAVQPQVLGLVRQRVDMGACVLGHHDHA